MAKTEADREDLFGEATAYQVRGEFTIPELAEPVFAGIREEGQFSVYLGADPVYHFNKHGQLRRAYISGLLYRTQGTTLACLNRLRNAEETILERRDLTPDMLQELEKTVRQQIQKLGNSLENSQAQILKSTVAAESYRQLMIEACRRVLAQNNFLAPRIPGKR